MDLVSKAGNVVLNLAFPQPCHVCSAPVKDSRLGIACARCWEDTQLFDGSEGACLKCGSIGVSACRLCGDHHYDMARSLGAYEKALSASVLHLKRVPVIAKAVSKTIPVMLERSGFGDCDLVIPVPLSAKRRIERGYNQAEVIADRVARIIGVAVDRNTLIRKTHTPMHRAAMDRKARELTVKNAFAVQRPKMIEGRRVLLVDDIFTSGATASNCARALKKAGAVSVNVFTLARAA